jgi:hypothetical protein
MQMYVPWYTSRPLKSLIGKKEEQVIIRSEDAEWRSINRSTLNCWRPKKKTQKANVWKQKPL